LDSGKLVPQNIGTEEQKERRQSALGNATSEVTQKHECQHLDYTHKKVAGEVAVGARG